jgi:hypothetical protein
MTRYCQGSFVLKREEPGNEFVRYFGGGGWVHSQLLTYFRQFTSACRFSDARWGKNKYTNLK